MSAGEGFVGPTLKHPAVAPDFALKDQNGRVLRLSDQRGKVVLITFLYTHCPDLCPMTASNINAALRSLGTSRKRVVVLSVSVDPSGDTPRSVKTFIRQHGLLPQFHYLTGPVSTMKPIWRAYQVQAVRPAGPDVDHTLYTLLLDRNGRGRVLFDSLAKPAAIAHDSRLLLR
ncbi:MAG: hypothetical protein QOH23_1695 [Gaiellaceae bacterium]|nr:hypothetical protein [Gaiellaceae bacterium]